MLNKRLEKIHKNLDKYFIENEWLFADNKECVNLVFDIEVSPNKDKNKAITYSLAIMECDNDSDICYKYNDVSEVLNMLLSLNTEKVNIYVHNLFYDIKPLLIEFIKMYGNNPIDTTCDIKEVYNIFMRRTEKVKYLKEFDFMKKPKPYQYNLCLKKGQLYGATFYGYNRKKQVGKKTISKPIEIHFHDTFKIVPYGLQKCCSAFLDLDLPKDGLDYDKVRNVDDKLLKEEKEYIYNDVFGLKYLVNKLIVNGFDLNGKKVQYTKITNSSQSLYDYKITLFEDFRDKKNCFENEDLYQYVDSIIFRRGFYQLKENQFDTKINLIFEALFPPQNYFDDSWLRGSYFGGLSYVDFKNVKKYEKRKKKKGVVLDVNSLYPFTMETFLLPYGHGSYSKEPYINKSEEYKKQNPLYVQEITIYDMKLKKGKTAFVQVKRNKDFNGRNVLEENINLRGKKVPIKLTLTNVLINLLFENYDVNSYKLGCHMGFRGSHKLFENYLSYWKEIKTNSKGANREIAKLRQNALYGKFGSSGDNEITSIDVTGGKFSVNHTHEQYVTENIYVVMSSFITSYSKAHLIKAINNNRDRFLYTDTDSVHLFGDISEVKGVEIDEYKYGAWKHELTFDDFKYIGAKRYAERDSESKKWDIKCCGLSDSIMKQVDDISVFGNCEYSSKELKKVKLYTNDSIYYYKDKECTKKVIGLIKSKKARIVEGGTLIIEQPYMLNSSSYFG